MNVIFYFDFSCPYAYLASKQIEELTTRHGASLTWRPMLLGGVFQETGLSAAPMAQFSAAKSQHNASDMKRWAEFLQLPLAMPPGHPHRTVKALRAVLSLPEAKWPTVIHSIFDAYWCDNWSIADDEGLRKALTRAELSADEVSHALAANEDTSIKDELRARTKQAVGDSVFGAPAMLVSGGHLSEPTLLWGQDRMQMLDAILGGWNPDNPRPDSPAHADVDKPPRIEFWYDFSSPFAYLASTQIAALNQRYGIDIVYKPMLLGAVFKQHGGPIVPIQTMVDAKRRYMGQDLSRWANYWGVPFKWPSRFPMRTVTALRLALLAGDKLPALTDAIFAAYWAEDKDINDNGVLGDILTAVGLTPELIERTQQPEIKQNLIDHTTLAIERGVFGAPGWYVDNGDKQYLLWGQDRIPLLEAMIQGFQPSE